MAQFEWVPSTIDPATTSGTKLAADLDDMRDAVYSCHSGVSAPSYADSYLGMLWIDNTTLTSWKLYVHTQAGEDVQLFDINADTGALNASFVASNIVFDPSGSSWTSTNLQDLGEEIDSKTAKLTGAAFTGQVYVSGTDVGFHAASNVSGSHIAITDPSSSSANYLRGLADTLAMIPNSQITMEWTTATTTSYRPLRVDAQYIDIDFNSTAVAYQTWRNNDGGIQMQTDDGHGNYYQVDANSAAHKLFLQTLKNSDTIIFHNGAERIRATAAGSTTQGVSSNTTDVGITSDRRLKSDIEYIEPSFALESLVNLKGHTHKKVGADKRLAGVFAQDVQKFCPESVWMDENEEFLNLSLSWMPAFVPPALAELDRRLRELEAV